MLSAFREMQIPLLAALLLLACSGKAVRAARSRSIDEGLGPTTMFPMHLRRPVAMVMCATEFGLGLMLIATAGPLTAWPAAATPVRLGVVLLFATATAALIELRAHRPDVGCGCFGDLSSTPVSMRTIARSGLFTIAAAATVGVPPVRLTAGGIYPWRAARHARSPPAGRARRRRGRPARRALSRAWRGPGAARLP